MIPQQTASPIDGTTASAPHFVQGMGLFSATAIVMGSMIGSGIFIVPADMSRVLGSPALLIAAWLVTALMTIIGALSYGELAAMMPAAAWTVCLSARIAGADLGIFCTGGRCSS